MGNRLTSNDTIQDMIKKLVDGNPGATVALVRVSQQHAQIDPDNILGFWGILMDLDTHGLYGGNIYVLMNDYCQNDVVKFVATLRAAQLGIIPDIELHSYATRPTQQYLHTADDLLAAVMEELPNFNQQ